MAGPLPLSLGVLLIVLALTLGETGVSGLALAGLAVADAGLLAWFAMREVRVPAPIVPPRLWALAGFTLSNVTALLVTAGMFGIVFLFTQYMQRILGYGPLQAGALTLPGRWPVITAPIAGKLVAKLSTKPILTVGAILQALALAWFAVVIGPYVPYLLLLPGLVLAGAVLMSVLTSRARPRVS